MGCPVHIWAPAAAALVPAARLMRFRVRDRLTSWRSTPRAPLDAPPADAAPDAEAPAPLRRFAPVDPHAPRG